MTTHYFIGIPVSDEIQEKLTEWQETLRSSMSYRTWTHPEDFHITLKFLGPASDDKIRKLIHDLEESRWPSPFTLDIGPASSFGDSEQPRVFHARVESHSALVEMKNQVETLSETYGWEREKRPFRPHVTLAKKNPEGVSPLIQQNQGVLEDVYAFEVNRCILYRIHPGQIKKYEAIAIIYLREEE
ncbi:RNA 2',3'-cyclic phosphodiesterase [Halobacillus fulvus]|nr:RNA 2',3'-cyclic phosphodiesterase [Halobacillus fulvus]